MRQLGECGRQISGAGHLRAMQQHWNHTNASLERRCNLDSDEVVLASEPPSARFVGRFQPVRADQGEKYVGSLDSATDGLDKILARLPRIDVTIDPLASESINEAIVDSSGVASRVFPSIADEDSGHRLFVSGFFWGAQRGPRSLRRPISRAILDGWSSRRDGDPD